MIVTEKFTFEAAHHLPDYPGKCANIHGHSYRLEVAIEGRVDKETGMVMDFKDISKIVQEHALSVLDHSDLNKTIENPTAENTVKWIWHRLDTHLNLSYLRLWESDTSSVIYNGKED